MFCFGKISHCRLLLHILCLSSLQTIMVWILCFVPSNLCIAHVLIVDSHIIIISYFILILQIDFFICNVLIKKYDNNAPKLRKCHGNACFKYRQDELFIRSYITCPYVQGHLLICFDKMFIYLAQT